MKIVVLGTRGFPYVQGGVEAHCEHLYPLIVKLGCHVTVITRKTYVDPSIKEFKGVHLCTVNNPKSKYLEAIIHTFSAILKAKLLGCDIVHMHAIGPALLVPFAKILGLKVVMTNHGPDYDRQKWGRFAKGILRLGEYFGSKWANKVISISKTISDNLTFKYNCLSEIIPNGVVVPEICETSQILKKFGLEKRKYVLAIGRFVPEKGFHDLIEAFCNLKAYDLQFKANNMKLAIVGNADHEDNYSKELRAKSEGVVDVILTGQLTGQPLQELYSHAGLFILPSYHEGLPIVLLEAMSYGLSCIASDIPANREVDLDEDRYFMPRDIEALATKIKDFIDRPLSDEEKRTQIAMIVEHYNWENISKKTLEVYKKVAFG